MASIAAAHHHHHHADVIVVLLVVMCLLLLAAAAGWWWCSGKSSSCSTNTSNSAFVIPRPTIGYNEFGAKNSVFFILLETPTLGLLVFLLLRRSLWAKQDFESAPFLQRKLGFHTLNDRLQRFVASKYMHCGDE